MDWKTFIVELVKALAWPIVIAILVFLLKDKLTDLLLRIRKIKHKDIEIELNELGKVITEIEIEKEKNIDSLVRFPPETTEKYNFLIKLAETSPRSAILEAFRNIEFSATRMAEKLHLDAFSIRKGISPYRIGQMLAATALNKHSLSIFYELRTLRNQAAHVEDFNLQDMQIEAYIDLALTLSDQIDSLTKNISE